MKHAEAYFAEHPSDEQIDRLRAELYDDAPELRDAVRAHLSACTECRTRTDIWRYATTALDAMETPALMAALRARRQHAQNGAAAHRRAAPRMVHAFAATITAVAIGLAVMLYFDAGTDDGAVTASEQSDIYADLDFYLWLTEEQDGDDAAPSS